MDKLFAAQRAFYRTAATRPVAHRIMALKRLRQALARHEEDLLRALAEDLGKSPEEAFMTELGMLYASLRHTLRHVRRWATPRLALPSLGQLPASARVLRDPFGVCLVLSPWNYPLYLSLAPVIAAVAAGNCAILRPSSQAPKVAETLARVVAEAFDPAHVTVALGDANAAGELLNLPFDKIFFTGSPAVGRRVMRAAAEHLSPVTLELGGKSPAIVASDADIPLAARRIVFGKLLNAGQTCVAPDYVLAAEGIAQKLADAMRAEIRRQLGEHPLQSPDLSRIIGKKHFDRLLALAPSAENDPNTLKIAPTLLPNAREDDPVMREEIFGPILPILTFRTMEEALASVRRRPHPLAFYLFTSDRDAGLRVLRDMAFGGGCLNDCVMHLAGEGLPFGGVGESGMGAYHGKAGFDCFSREKSVLLSSRRVDAPFRYAPRKGRMKLLRLFFRA